MLAVGTDDGIRVFDRHGSSWRPGPAALEGVAVTQIAVERGRPAHLLASTRPGVYESDDGAASSRPPLDRVAPRPAAFDAHGPPYAGTSPPPAAERAAWWTADLTFTAEYGPPQCWGGAAL